VTFLAIGGAPSQGFSDPPEDAFEAGLAERMQPIIYRRRRGAVSRGEREWRVEDDALVTRGPRGGERRIQWKDFISVRLYCEAARGRPWRYVFELQPRHARRVVIDNAHCVGPGRYEDRSSSYTPFVRAALQRISAANPKARALTGETPRRYFFLLLCALLGFGALAFGLIAVRTPLDPHPYAMPLKLGLILLMLPVFWIVIIRAMPRGLPLDQVPERVLPQRGCGEARPAPQGSTASPLP
jgi:hypothetical protein